MSAATDLAREPAPRSEATVAAVSAQLTERTRKLRRGVMIGVLVPALFTTGLFLVLDFTSPIRYGDGPRGTSSLLVIIFGWGPMLYACWRYISADLIVVRRLVRDGIVYEGRVVGAMALNVAARFYNVSWVENGQRHVTRVRTQKISAPVPIDVTVLVSPRVRRQVGVFLGDNGLYIGNGR